MCWHLSNGDVAMSLSRITGSSYENSLMSLNHIGNPQVLGLGGRLNAKVFATLARRNPLVSESAICSELGSLTGRGFENVLMDLNRIDLAR
jgi:hypothetical protein